MALKAGYVGIKNRIKWKINKLASMLPAEIPEGDTLALESEVVSRVAYADAVEYVGRNKAVNNMSTHTIVDLIFTVNDDKSISLSGTPTNDISNTPNGGLIWDGVDTLPYGRYKLSGCPSGGSSSTYRLLIMNTANNQWVTDLGEGAEFTVDDTTSWKELYIRINTNVDMTGKVFKPMIVPIGVPSTPYEPHLVSNPELLDKITTLQTSDAAKLILADFKTLVAEAADFAAFQTAVAAYTPAALSTRSADDAPDPEEDKPVTKKRTSKKKVEEE